MKIELEARASRGQPQIQEAAGPLVTIGSGADCDLSVVGDGIEYTHVSPQHAKIELTPRGAMLSDAGSEKGTWVNGRSVQQPMVIRQGSRFQLGRLGPTVTVKSLDLTAAPQPAAAPRSGKRSLLTIAAVALLALLAVGAGSVFYLQRFGTVDPGVFIGGDGDHFAVVIAVGDYPDAQPLDDVEFADEDAVKLAEALHATGYDVTLMSQSIEDEEHLRSLQPTAANIRRKLEQALKANRDLDGADSVLVAVIGQCVHFEGEGLNPGSNAFFFCPADADVRGIKNRDQVSPENNLLGLEELYSTLAQSRGARTKLIYLDACRVNPSAAAGAESLQVKTMPELPLPPQGVAAIFSCSVGEQTQVDPDLEGSVSAHFLAQGVAGAADDKDRSDGAITVDELSRYVAANATHHAFTYRDGAKQRPDFRGRELREHVLARLGKRGAEIPTSAAASPAGSTPVAATPASAVSTPASSPPLTAEQQLASQTHAVLQKYCADCHLDDESSSLDNVLSHAALTTSDAGPFVVAKDLEASPLWVRAVKQVGTDEQMPPPEEGVAQPNDEERKLIEKWILAGAPPFPEVAAAPSAGNGALRLAAGDAEKQLANQARTFLQSYCTECHGDKRMGQFPDALNPSVLLSAGPKGQFITPGSPEQSRVWIRIEDGTMPKGDRKPSAEEQQAFRDWIAAGAPNWETDAAIVRTPLPLSDVLLAMEADLRETSAADRPYRRYLTLDHLHNNSYSQRAGGRNVNELELRQMRAAASKVLNSLSWAPQIRAPQLLGSQGTVLAIDLRHYGWDAEDWQELVAEYPYGLRLDGHRTDDALARAAEEVYSLSRTKLPFIRADWFVNNAPRPEHYYRLLDLPTNVRQLERQLGVNPEQDFLDSRLIRAGFRQSGVSNSNRLVDRHEIRIGPSGSGYYWKSYDFGRSGGRGNLEQFPLGPSFPQNPFAEFAFDPDGGEMIFTLPNGMQAYYLAKADGERLDAGPIEVVKDKAAISGSNLVVCGLSCMYCHANGMIPCQDAILEHTPMTGDALKKARSLYAPQDELDAVLARDEAIFTEALHQATAPFLLQGEDADGDVRKIEEPVGAMALRFQDDFGLEDAAAELHTTPERLKIQIESAQQFRELGLAPLASGGAIKRDLWETRATPNGPTTFQELARQIHSLEPVIAGNN